MNLDDYELIENILMCSPYSEKFEDEWNNLFSEYLKYFNGEHVDEYFNLGSICFGKYLKENISSNKTAYYWNFNKIIYLLHADIDSFGNRLSNYTPEIYVKRDLTPFQAYSEWKNFLSKIEEKIPKFTNIVVESSSNEKLGSSVLPKINCIILKNKKQKFKLTFKFGKKEQSIIVLGYTKNNKIILQGIWDVPIGTKIELGD